MNESPLTSTYVVVNDTKQTMPNAGFAELMTAVLTRNVLFRFQASGSSMSPFIHDSDVITITPAPTRLCSGDVVAFVNPCNGRLTVHRVVHIEHHGYLIRGDNVPGPDGYVQHTDILGRVIHAERRGRRVWIGLGLERVMIAFLSRRGWLIPLVMLVRRIFNFFFERHIA